MGLKVGGKVRLKKSKSITSIFVTNMAKEV
jgi:hypothetical protein